MAWTLDRKPDKLWAISKQDLISKKNNQIDNKVSTNIQVKSEKETKKEDRFEK